MDKYKQEKKSMSPNDFADFLKLNLIHKHQVLLDDAEDMAKTLIEGKKRVRDGEYAYVREEISEGSDSAFYSYFRRVKNYWVEDPNIDEQAFIDTNTLFCNINNKCIKNEANSQCESDTVSKIRMLEQTKNRMKSEFDIRLAGSIEELEKKIKQKIAADLKRISKEQLLNIVNLED